VQSQLPNFIGKRKSFTLNAISLISVFGIFLSIFIPSYYNWNLTEILSNRVKDGWCNPQKEGVGLHCFGDFFAPIGIAGNQDPWEVGINPNPPFAMLIFKLFYFISNLTTPRISLLLYLLIIFIAFSLPALHAWRQSTKLYQEKLLYLLVYFTSMPAISLFDRGNVIALTLPMLYFSFLCIQKNPHITVVLLVAAVLIKPQLAIFSIILLATRNYRYFATILVSGTVLNLMGFLFFHNPKVSFINWISSIINYPSYAGEGKIYPVNISLRNTLYLMDKSFQSNLSDTFIQTTASIVVLIFVVSLLFSINRLPLGQIFYQVVILSLVAGGTVFSYYAIYLTLMFIFLAFFGLADSIFERPFSSLCTTALLLLAVPTSPLSWRLFPFLSHLGQATVSITWTLTQCTLVLVMATLTFENISKKFKGIAVDPKSLANPGKLL
jgi:hypothetical protein